MGRLLGKKKIRRISGIPDSSVTRDQLGYGGMPKTTWRCPFLAFIRIEARYYSPFLSYSYDYGDYLAGKATARPIEDIAREYGV